MLLIYQKDGRSKEDDDLSGVSQKSCENQVEADESFPGTSG